MDVLMLPLGLQLVFRQSSSPPQPLPQLVLQPHPQLIPQPHPQLVPQFLPQPHPQSPLLQVGRWVQVYVGASIHGRVWPSWTVTAVSSVHWATVPPCTAPVLALLPPLGFQ